MNLSEKEPQTTLYNQAEEKDACGLAFVATLKKEATRKIVEYGLEALLNLDHRGAVGAEENTGDGAGILVSTPDAFLRRVFGEKGIELPKEREYAVGIAFLSQNPDVQKTQINSFEKFVKSESLEILGSREVEIDDSMLGSISKGAMPKFVQFIIADIDRKLSGIELDRSCFRVRKLVQNEVDLYFASLSSSTITYKGMLTTKQLPQFFLDLQQPDFCAKIALVHSRFSTNTFPAWNLAQPLRSIAHNGEINTIRGNRNWFRAREGMFETDKLSGKNSGSIKDLLPILTEGASDSASFDETLELLHLSGRSLPHSVLMMIPEPWENWDENTLDDKKRKLKAFYEFNSTLIEPWDGPASLSFTDGDLVGSTLDRNGLRPGRFWVTDELVVMGSEAGILHSLNKSKVVRKGRLEPGKMLLVDTVNAKIIENDEIKNELANENPYEEWLKDGLIKFEQLPNREHIVRRAGSVLQRQRAFGFTEEEVKLILEPMAKTGKEPLGAMGTDTPIAVLSNRERLLFDYFFQEFAQVTNPPLDSIREEIVTSISSAIGPEPNLLSDSKDHALKLSIPFPVIDNDELAKIEHLGNDPKTKGKFKPVKISGLFEITQNPRNSLKNRLDEILKEIDTAFENGANCIILSDRNSNQSHAPIPSLLLTSTVQHHMIKNRRRTQVSLVVEAGDVRETHHVALLIGFGAACVNPYLALETVENLTTDDNFGIDSKTATKNLIKALGSGVLKIMSKMGISTIMSYRGSQIFGAVGLSKELIDSYFTGTTSKLGGIGLEQIAIDTVNRHKNGFPQTEESVYRGKLRTGGEYKYRKTGESHQYSPEAIFYLQQSTKKNDYGIFKKFSSIIDDSENKNLSLRSLLKFKKSSPISIDEVESIETIMHRFSTGAMSYGSISIEAHETLAKAMNSIGARSNSGEGGEEKDRLYDENRRSKIKQVASGRFGVTSEYLVSATDIQIKLAQGAKPGEGGHLPGEKVYPWIANVRMSTPGIDLVSPPPHHDIYSIEDLAQLIHDLKMANPDARIHVKLVSEYGVGTVAAGVSKTHADVVLISGFDGGTGAAPLSSIKHAGLPWEIGLAETHQTLVKNDLRDRVVVQCDGQLKTGRDVVVSALLGAEEFGFATAPLIVEGCVMMRVCNKNTCPVGVATQDPLLRSNFKGKAEHVVNYFKFVAEEIREIMAELGIRKFEELVGRSDLLEIVKNESMDEKLKISRLELENMIAKPQNELRKNAPLVQSVLQNHALEESLDFKLIPQINFETLKTEKQTVESEICNIDRSFGTLIGNHVTKRHNSQTSFLEDDSLILNVDGIAGQSLGAFLPNGITINLRGETNDYAAKGLSGGKVIVRADDGKFDAHCSIIAGNVLGFGATSGIGYFHGIVGERFAVRNSGATFVCEGTGEHALEYMTGGKCVILGQTGKNLGAGFLGGVAYVLDFDDNMLNKQAKNSDSLRISSLFSENSEEIVEIKNIITDYAEKTNSNFAKNLLNSWDETVKRISKIIPRKYEKIIQIDEPENNWKKVMEIVKNG